jgi:ankyrin repeat protein
MHYAGEVPNNKAIVTMLVQYGALDAHVHPTSDLSRQFLAAVFLADEARVRSLLARHPELATTADGRGDLPIHHAARNGDTEIVRQLIEAGSEVTSKTTRNHTVVYCAGGHGHLETLKLLVSSTTTQPEELASQINDLIEWLADYPDDWRYKPIAAFLSSR